MLAANLALMKPQELVDWQQYQVRAGDTLGTIANRHHLTVNIIRDVNRLKATRCASVRYSAFPPVAMPRRRASCCMLHVSRPRLRVAIG